MSFEQGVQAQKSGKLAEAEAIYRKIVAADAGNFDALHMLAVVCSEQGKTDEAARLFQQAEAVDQTFPPFFHNFGLHHSRLKQYESAIAQFDKAIKLYPNYPPVLSDRGNALAEIGRLPEAIESHDKAVTLAPNIPQVFANRGLTFFKLKDYTAALRDYDEALKRAPNFPNACVGRGNALLELRRNDDALAAFDQAIALKADLPEAWLGRGNAMSELNRSAEALAAYDKALSLQPSMTAATGGRAIALTKLKRFDEAFANVDKAIAQRPDLAGPWAARGDALFELRRYGEAANAYGKALALQPDFAEARFSEGFVQLLLGDTDNGWKNYEARWDTRQYAGARRPFAQPQWSGDGDIAGKTILVHAEQGLGDTLMMCRYVPLVAARGVKVILEVQPSLAPLMQSLQGVSQVVAKGSMLPHFDLHCPIMSLPLAFGTRMDAIPANAPYLKAPDDAVAHWLPKFPRGGLKVGLAWAGNPTYGKDQDRSILLKNILPASSVEGAMCFGIQKDLRAGDRELMKANPQIIYLGGAMTDFRDTAAIMSCLDLIISSDTSIVHLAGALGRPVWVLLPANPDWRWYLERGDSPWYPTARLFRQNAEGSWRPVMDEVRAELLNMVKAGGR